MTRMKYVNALGPVFPFVAELTYEQARAAVTELVTFQSMGPAPSLVGVADGDDLIAASSFAVVSRPSPGDDANIMLWMSHASHQRLQLPNARYHGGHIEQAASTGVAVRHVNRGEEPADAALAVVMHEVTGKPIAVFARDDHAAHAAGYAMLNGKPTGLRWFELGADTGAVAWPEITTEYEDSPIVVVRLPATA
jgi:hypothetical protein